MPSQPAWFYRLSKIILELEALPASHLDRQAVESLFGVAERRARQLMANLPAIQVGNAYAVERLALVAWLKEMSQGSAFRQERLRRHRVVDQLDQARRSHAARQVQLPVIEASLPSLPEGVTLIPGQLILQFETAEDLAARLYSLSQIMANDWQAFSKRVTRKPHS